MDGDTEFIFAQWRVKIFDKKGFFYTKFVVIFGRGQNFDIFNFVSMVGPRCLGMFFKSKIFPA